MKKLVVFKRRKKEVVEGPSASPFPIFNPDDVETPEAKRSLKAFKERRDYVMIIQYRAGVKKHSDYQKIGFKVDGGFEEAAQRASIIARMLGKAMAVDLHEIRNVEMCRVLSVYEVTAFKDWENEADISKGNKHIDEIVRQSKNMKPAKPISYAKAAQVKVRG